MECKDCQNYKPKRHQLDEMIYSFLNACDLRDINDITTRLKKLRWESIKWALSQKINMMKGKEKFTSYKDVLIRRGKESWIQED